MSMWHLQKTNEKAGKALGGSLECLYFNDLG